MAIRRATGDGVALESLSSASDERPMSSGSVVRLRRPTDVGKACMEIGKASIGVTVRKLFPHYGRSFFGTVVSCEPKTKPHYDPAAGLWYIVACLCMATETMQHNVHRMHKRYNVIFHKHGEKEAVDAKELAQITWSSDGQGEAIYTQDELSRLRQTTLQELCFAKGCAVSGPSPTAAAAAVWPRHRGPRGVHDSHCRCQTRRQPSRRCHSGAPRVAQRP